MIICSNRARGLWGWRTIRSNRISRKRTQASVMHPRVTKMENMPSHASASNPPEAPIQVPPPFIPLTLLRRTPPIDRHIQAIYSIAVQNVPIRTEEPRVGCRHPCNFEFGACHCRRQFLLPLQLIGRFLSDCLLFFDYRHEFPACQQK